MLGEYTKMHVLISRRCLHVLRPTKYVEERAPNCAVLLKLQNDCCFHIE
jgi:hypothetical protein